MGHHTHVGECLGNLLHIEIREADRFKIEFKIGVAHNSGYLTGKECIVFVVGQVLQLLSLELVKVGVDALQVAIRLKHRGGLFITDAGNTRDVIGLVAFETQKIRELGRRYAVALLHFFRAIDNHIGNSALSGYDFR